jgi:hypothetical protein
MPQQPIYEPHDVRPQRPGQLLLREAQGPAELLQ